MNGLPARHTTKSQVSDLHPTKSSSDEDLDPGITSDDQLFDLQMAAENETPPTNRLPKYKCPYCEKGYPENQRHFYTRHIKQRKCIVNSNSSASKCACL